MVEIDVCIEYSTNLAGSGVSLGNNFVKNEPKMAKFTLKFQLSNREYTELVPRHL